jgi:hypothetical protein
MYRIDPRLLEEVGDLDKVVTYMTIFDIEID